MGDKISRKPCIQNNFVCLPNFIVSNNPNPNGDAPNNEIADFRAIIYMETSPGYVGAPVDRICIDVERLDRIRTNVRGTPIKKFATLYNNLNALTGKNYGIHVKKIYDDQSRG